VSLRVRRMEGAMERWVRDGAHTRELDGVCACCASASAHISMALAGLACMHACKHACAPLHACAVWSCSCTCMHGTLI